jgi:hypothetical protein
MHEDSYRDGSTDGVEFRVEYAPADPSAARVILFRKVLRPRTNPSDRELQTFKVDLPSAAKGGRLVLRTAPAGRLEWDWAGWSNIRLLTPMETRKQN